MLSLLHQKVSINKAILKYRELLSSEATEQLVMTELSHIKGKKVLPQIDVKHTLTKI